jgi:hypothetical protein
LINSSIEKRADVDTDSMIMPSPSGDIMASMEAANINFSKE